MVENCGACGIRYEREAGYWIGAMIINTIAVSLSFLGVSNLRF